VNKTSVLEALKNKTFTDLEDGLQYQCTREKSVDCIVTQNKADFVGSKYLFTYLLNF